MSDIVALSAVFVPPWGGNPALRFILGVAGAITIQVLVFYYLLARTSLEGRNRPITLATWITIARGSALALLAGFLFTQPPTGLGWLPAVLFAIAAGLDAVDGAVARATDSVSEFGGRLDTEIDALTVLCGALIAVSYGLAPVVFLAVALARYTFVAGIAFRRRRGLVVSELDSSQLRRLFGASAMIAIWIALLPIPGETISWLVTTAVVVPFLVQFSRDWLVVSGRLERPTEQ